MAVRVDVSNAHRRYRIGKKQVGSYVQFVFKKERRKRGEVSVVFVDDRIIRKLNREYLSHDYVTDVISFPLTERRGEVQGEIYISADRARVQANRFGVRFGEEIARLVIHGTLHLIGYDDTTPRAAAEMKKREDRFVRNWFENEKGAG